MADIYGDSFKEAVKNYVKFNHKLNITNMIIKDQSNHYNTKLRYYIENNKNKVGIDVYPYTNVFPYTNVQPVMSSVMSPVMSPAMSPVMSPVMSPAMSLNPMVKVNGSPYMANNQNVIVSNPFFY